MNISKRHFLPLFALLVAVLSVAAHSRADELSGLGLAEFDERNPVTLYGEKVLYDIYRNGKNIGQHSVRFIQTNAGLNVEIESNIVVRVLKVPVYKFNYRSNELWVDGQLQKVEAITNDNGKQHSVSAKRTGTNMVLLDKNGKRAESKLAYASNHWNPKVLTADALFNTLTGKPNTIVLETVGKESLLINEQSVEATNFKLSGDIKTNVWYDNSGRWVQLRFLGDDGSVIEYRCKGFNL